LNGKSWSPVESDTFPNLSYPRLIIIASWTSSKKQLFAVMEGEKNLNFAIDVAKMAMAHLDLTVKIRQMSPKHQN